MTISASTTRNRFPKTQRLCSRKSIDALFQGGDGRKTVSAFPIRAVFMNNEAGAGEPPMQVLISVAKRHLRHATDRNRAKRQMREAWRLNRDIIPQELTLNIAFLWLADTPQPTPLIRRKMRNLLHRISELCSQQR
ncbi:MAG: ribonuclease P protein component [Bacteroidaceae bacterium]|nr:ribonuclease P protein component [Bacteroidaceae bacterium]